MRLLAYSSQRYERGTKKLWQGIADGGMFITSPPCQEPDIPAIWLSGYDAIYIDLHGEPGETYLYGDDGAKALSLHTVRKSWVQGAVVFLTTCYLPETGFVEAFLDAGASAVIGGAGSNWGGRRWPHGAQHLGRLFLELYAKELPAEYALKCAKHRLRWDVWQRVLHPKATRDALGFQIWRRNAKV